MVVPTDTNLVLEARANVTKIEGPDFNRGSHQLHQINIFEKQKDARLIWQLGISGAHQIIKWWAPGNIYFLPICRVERHGPSFSGSSYRSLRARISIAMHDGIAFPPPHGLGKQHARCQRRNQERWSRNRRRKARSWGQTKESRR